MNAPRLLAPLALVCASVTLAACGAGARDRVGSESSDEMSRDRGNASLDASTSARRDAGSEGLTGGGREPEDWEPADDGTTAAGQDGGTARNDTTAAQPCTGPEQPIAKRIVRLSFGQLANSMGALIAPELTPQLIEENDIPVRAERGFPVLQSGREGNVIDDNQWATIDAMMTSAAQYVFDHLDQITPCSIESQSECAFDYLSALAEQAYRRPLTPSEQADVVALVSALDAEPGASIADVVQYGVYAILHAPQFLYRTELGSDWRLDESLTAYEFASALSYFLTDSMPDPELLEAARNERLSSVADIEAQVERLLQTTAARQNLESAMVSYFNLPSIGNLVIEDVGFTPELGASMYREGELFLHRALWSLELDELLLSKQTMIDDQLAQIYGVPPPNNQLDADGFGPVELPDERSGLLTMPGFLTTRSLPNGTNLWSRGQTIRHLIACRELPPVPEAATADPLEQLGTDLTQREVSLYLQVTNDCSGCHSLFDPYGLVLENFDLLGRLRETDEANNPIDTSTTLPPELGLGRVANVVELAQRLAQTDTFSRCMGESLVNFALADTVAASVDVEDCVVERVTNAYRQAPQHTFSSMIKAVASSGALMTRMKGRTP